MKRIISLVSLLVIVVLALAGCKAVKNLEGQEFEDAKVNLVPIAENLLTGFTQKDFAIASRDFGANMVKAMTEDKFISMAEQFEEKLGAFQSSQLDSIAQTGEYLSVNFTLVYEKAPKVTMRVVCSAAEPYQVTGLWFDAPELR